MPAHNLTPTAITMNSVIQQISETLGLSDTKRLQRVILELISNDVSQGSEFARRIRTRYDALEPPQKLPVRKSKSSSSENIVLKPVGRVDGYEFRPEDPPNPFVLYKLYGQEQLPAALSRYSLTHLQQSVRFVQQRYPNTKPLSSRKKADIIEYLVNQTVVDK